MPNKPPRGEDGQEQSTDDLTINLGNLLGGLGGNLQEIITRLGEIIEQTEENEYSVEKDIRDHKGKVRGHMGITIGSMSSTNPRSPVRSTPPKSTESELREPAVDIFEEGEEIWVVVELTGVEESEIELTLVGDQLNLRTEGARRYAVTIALPRAPVAITAQSMNNGLLEIHLK